MVGNELIHLGDALALAFYARHRAKRRAVAIPSGVKREAQVD